MKRMLLLVAAIALGALWGKVQAQAVYKCSSDSYSEQPCSTRIVHTYSVPIDRVSDRSAGEVVAHRLPGETPDELALREHRVHLSRTDRDECARLDKKIPFEQERIRNSVIQDEVDEAQESLGDAKSRFSRLHC